MAYFKRRKELAHKTISLNDEATAALKEQQRSFREKFGADPGPEDPIFFDPDADTPQPISKAGLDEMMGQILSATGKAGIRPEHRRNPAPEGSRRVSPFPRPQREGREPLNRF